MELKLLKIEEASSDQWDSIADNCDYATYFHTREWAEIWQEYSGGKLKPAAKILTFNDGVEVLFPMSVTKVFRGMLRQYILSPENNYGGWLSVNKLSAEHHKLLWEYATTLNLIMRHNPYDSELQAAAKSRSWSFSDFTQALDLQQGFETISQSWQREQGKLIRKAQKAGMTLVEAKTLEDWQEYYKVYEATVERWGDKILGSPYEWRLFEFIYNLRSNKIKLWLAKVDGQVARGGIFFYQSKHVVGWHGSGLKELFHLRPSNFLHTQLVEKACQEGYWWYDFNPSGGLEGVTAFKETFGCQKLQFNLFINKLAARKLIDNTKEIIANRNLKVLSHK